MPVLFLVRLAAAASLFALISCILGEGRHSGRGSEVENEVHGVLVATNGKSVAGARVIALGLATTADADTVFTDNRGRYRFDSLPVGGYNLLGEHRTDSLVVLIPGVEVAIDGKATDAGTDTLRTPGRIRGRVLAGDSGKPAVLCYIPGTSFLSASNDSGRFDLTGLPQGKHVVAYSAAGYTIAADSNVEVLSGRTTLLPDKQLEHDPDLQPPAPENLKAALDTALGHVTLTWDAVAVSDLKEYIIYRDLPGLADPPVLATVTGTRHVDKVVFQEGEQSRPLVYRIRSRDIDANVSAVYSRAATIPVFRHEWSAAEVKWACCDPDSAWDVRDSLQNEIVAVDRRGHDDTLVYTLLDGRVLKKKPMAEGYYPGRLIDTLTGILPAGNYVITADLIRPGFGLVASDSLRIRILDYGLGAHGILVDAEGMPLTGVRINALPVAWDNATASPDSSLTDASGRYSFRNLQKGRYEIYGRMGSGDLVVLIPGVDVAESQAILDIGTDTLRAPGRIRGKVFEGDAVGPGALCHIDWMGFMATSDDSGRFEIAGLPKGKNQVGCSAEGYLASIDSMVNVETGRATTLTDIRLAENPDQTPAPRNLKAWVEKVQGHIVLAWDPVNVSDLKEYIVYRERRQGGEEPNPIARTTEPRFVDTAAFQAGMPVPPLIYRVKSVDTGLNLSANYSKPAMVPGSSPPRSTGSRRRTPPTAPGSRRTPVPSGLP